MGNEVGRERNHFRMSCDVFLFFIFYFFFFSEEEKLSWFSVLPWRRRRGNWGCKDEPSAYSRKWSIDDTQ